MKLAIFISDRRMKEIYRELSTDYIVTPLYEHSNFETIKDIDILILPVKGLDENGHLHVGDTIWKIPKIFWDDLKDTCILFSGLPNAFLSTLDHSCYYYMQNETLLKKNAELTAEGVLFLLIDNTAKGLQYQKIDVIGYGRCGKAIFDWLKNLQIDVRVIRRVCDTNEHQVCVDDYIKMQPGDVVINTSIQKIITKKWMLQCEKLPLIIDIATPDVMDYEEAKKIGMRIIKAGNLPALIAYESAGNIIADYIQGVIENGE